MNVTAAKFEDREDLLGLITEYQKELAKADVKVPTAAASHRYLDELLKDDRHGHIFIGRTSSGQPVGFITIYFNPSTLHAQRLPTLLDLYILPAKREKGFGRQLFEHAIRWAKTRHHKTMIWFTENVNVKAQYLFDSYTPDSSGCVRYELDIEKHGKQA